MTQSLTATSFAVTGPTANAPCYACGHPGATVIARYAEPDKYERAIGITPDDYLSRSWLQCRHCGLYFSSFALHDANPMDPIYSDVYRSMRGESTRATFERITALPPEQSESHRRAARIKSEIRQLENAGVLAPIDRPRRFLDVGGGNAIFAHTFRDSAWLPHVVDPAVQGVELLAELGIPFDRQYYGAGHWPHQFDLITCIYMLEHVHRPKAILRGIADDLVPETGVVYLEIPDGVAFQLTDPADDIFNSCHLWMFEPLPLTQLLRDCGLDVLSLYREKQARGHYSLHVLARAGL